ncbi:MAG: XkdF-like putative serine protease domain-containing protein [Porcipelethomonas sp.]
MEKIEKSRCLSDAKIQFVSLVDKAANRRQFLITKAENGTASFSTAGRIIKTDSENHYVTGIVYEPCAEDTQGDTMTAEEITKAAYWFAKNGSGVDLQHNFEKFEDAAVVESWIAKSDFEVGGEKVCKGSWLMTVEISDPEVWTAVEKGEITGFSMGGTAVCTEKAEENEKKGFFKGMFGKIKKGAVADKFNQSAKSALFWQGYESLRRCLVKYNPDLGKDEFETDEETIREALTDFSAIIEGVLTEQDISAVLSAAVPAQPIEKAGKKISDKNMNVLEEIHGMLKTLIDSVKPAEEPVKKNDIEDIPEDIDARISEAVAKAVKPLYKARGMATNLNNEPEPVKKESDLFAGVFM